MKYKVEEPKIIDVLNKVSIPEYQRHLVWSNKTKQSFIESLILEFPIGVITAYEEVNSGKLTIIDGLQRLSTIIKFYSNPSEIISYSDLMKNLNLSSKEEFSTLTQKKSYFINAYFQEWYENLRTIDSNPPGGEYDFFVNLVKNYKEKFGDDTVAEYSRQIIKKYNLITSAILLSESTLPIIICQDLEEEELPIVFERMNTGSVKLSKYEIYISKWFAYGELTVSDMAVRENIIKSKKDKYEEIFEKKIESLDSEQVNDFQKIYIQDILIYYSSEYHKTPVTNKKKADEIAFELLSLVIINKVYGIDTLVKRNLILNGSYKEGVGDFLIDVLERIKLILKDNRIGLDETSKFKNYFYVASLFGISTEFDIENLSIEASKITDEMMEYVKSIEENFSDERQVTYLHGIIDKVIKDYKNLNTNEYDKVEMKATAKVVNITHAGNPHPEDKLRIQVVPKRLRVDRNKGYYTELFGKYEAAGETLYVKYNYEHATNSEAKNKSIYVQKKHLDKKLANILEKPDGVVDDYVDDILSEEEFNNKYLIY